MYAFASVSGGIECLMCRLGRETPFQDFDAFLSHLDEHKAAGHKVPERAWRQAQEDKAKNRSLAPLNEQDRIKSLGDAVDDEVKDIILRTGSAAVKVAGQDACILTRDRSLTIFDYELLTEGPGIELKPKKEGEEWTS